MVISLRVALTALSALAISSVLYAADADSAAAQQGAAIKVTSDKTESSVQREEAALQKAAEGVDPTLASKEPVSAVTQLPFDLKSAVDIALAVFGGEVLKAEQVEHETGIHYHIRVVKEGRVRDVVVDAANGEIVKPVEVDPAATVDAVTGPAETEGSETGADAKSDTAENRSTGGAGQ